MANSTIHVLYVDDSPVDRELVIHAIETESPGRYKVTQAGSWQEFQVKFAADEFDVVLSDFNILGFEGLQVLDLVHARDPRIPVILVTGTGNEEVAVEAMKRGASDYVIKSTAHIKRLSKTIEAALQNKMLREEREAAGQALSQSEQKFRSIVENSADGIILTDEAGGVIEWNKAMQSFTQITREEAVGHSLWEVQFRSVPPGLRTAATYEAMKQALQQLLSTGVSPLLSRVSEVDIVDKDGSPHHLQYQIFLINTEKGFTCGGIARDVTQQKFIETENRRKTDEFAALYETTRDFAGQRNLKDLLELILTRATALLNVSCGGVLSFDPIQETLEVVALIGVTLPPHAHIHLGVGLPGIVGLSKKPLIVPDYPNSEYFMPELELGANICTILAAPLLEAGELNGVILFGGTYEDHRQFDDADLRLITLFGAQAASAVHTSRLFEEAGKQAARFRFLYDAGLALNTIMDVTTQLEVLFNISMDALDCDRMDFFRYDPLRFELVFVTSNGFTQEYQDLLADLRISVLAGHTILAEVCKNLRPLIVSDVKKDSRYIQVDPKIISGLWVPVIYRDQLLGVLAVFHTSRKIFTSDDELLVTLLANQAAVALENARLFAETGNRFKQMQSLRTIDHAITGSLDIRLVLNVVLEELTSVLMVDAADILMLNQATHCLEYQVGRGFETLFLRFTNLPLGQGNAGKVGLKGEKIFIPDLAAVANSLEQSPYYRAEKFQAYFGVPLKSKGQVKGVLEIFQRSPLAPDQNWLDYLEAICEQAAIAVDNISMFNDLQHRTDELAVAYDATIEGWSHALDMRDQDTQNHSQRVTDLTLQLAAGFRFGRDELVHIRRGALLHDIGKMGIPDEILLKPGPLTPEEWEIMRRHPVYAHELILPVRFLHPAIDIPYCHHEKWDGSGYPRGLKGIEIPLAARIFAVVDVWDALISPRPYRAAWSEAKAFEYIQEQAGKHFDPEVVKAFINLTRVEAVE